MSEFVNYEDYTKEVINGQIYYMSLGTSSHMRILFRLSHIFHTYFYDKRCEIASKALKVFWMAKKARIMWFLI